MILTRLHSEPRTTLLTGLGLGAVFGTWNVIAARLSPLADDSAATLLMFYGPMFIAWGLVGFVATRRTTRLSSGVKAGAAVAFVTLRGLHCRRDHPGEVLVASAIGSTVGFVGGCCALAPDKSARC